MRHEVAGVVYGVRVYGRVPDGFAPYLWPCADVTPPAAALELRHETVEAVPTLEEVWASPADDPGFPDRFALGKLPDGFVLSVAGEEQGLFRCTPARIEVAWQTSGRTAPHHLFSYALPLWLETRGVPVLHGSAVTVGGRAVGFLAPTGTGKSVLCAELLRLGCAFLADDGLALERRDGGVWHCLQGPPLLRLWPSGLAGHLATAPETLETLPRVRAGVDKRRLDLPETTLREACLPDGRRLAALYVLERRPAADGAVTLFPYTPREALVRLLEHGVAAAPAAALGLARRRLDLLAAAAEAVPVRRLAFPSGAHTAAQVLAAIERDLRGA
jgi:hypothetical protein